MEKRKEFIVNALYISIITILIVLLFKYVMPFLVPFLIAFLISYILRKPIIFLNTKCKFNNKIASILCVSLFYIILGLFFTFFGVFAFYKIETFISSLPDLYVKYVKEILDNITTYIKNIVINFNYNNETINMINDIEKELITKATGIVSNGSIIAIKGISNVVTNVPSFFIKLVLMIISSFFMAIDYDLILKFFGKQLGNKTSNFIVETKNYLLGTILVCIKSYATIMSITFIELSIGLTLIGVENSIIIALLISIFDILPVLGTGGIMIPWAIISLLTNNIGLGISLAIIYLIITIIRNILEPKIVGKELGLHPLVTLVSMFIGGNVAGLIGLFGFPILLSLFVHLNNVGVINILKK